MTRTDLVRVRAIAPDDHPQWRRLFSAYRDFYRLTPDDEVVAQVWDWIIDPEHELHGIVAYYQADIVGIAHFRPFARPVSGTIGIWLDDLYTDPAARRQGVGEALIEHLRTEAKGAGASVVRWITASDNSTAQALYDRLGARTGWVTYDATP
ncbi:GNAT family N-acetyltransferase [Bacillus subtilis]|nr:GNAT family N-acetyltransferase [Bacillus subtilis]